MLTVTYEGTVNKNVMIYGHLDKQPPLTDKWSPGLGPYDPKIRGDLAYGRGVSDDGYVCFALTLAIKAAID